MRFTNRQILKIAGPILVSVLMEHLIGMTDTAFLGRVGEVELGASALAGVYYLAIFMLGFGFSTGVQIMIGRRNGEGNGMYGKHHSDETKRKIAESKIGKTYAPTHFKRVRCVETGKIYNSQSEAAQEYGITQAAISAVCKGKNKTAKKMHWEFVD